MFYEQLYCSYWGYKMWTTWLKGEALPLHGIAAPLLKRKTTPNYTLGAYNPVNFTVFNFNETG
jgi:hypothetical protein